KIALRQCCSRIVKQQRRGIGFQSQSFIEQWSRVGIVLHHAVPDGEFTKRIGQKRAILLRCLVELARPLQRLGVVVVLAQRSAANRTITSGLSAKGGRRE